MCFDACHELQSAHHIRSHTCVYAHTHTSLRALEGAWRPWQLRRHAHSSQMAHGATRTRKRPPADPLTGASRIPSSRLGHLPSATSPTPSSTRVHPLHIQPPPTISLAVEFRQSTEFGWRHAVRLQNCSRSCLCGPRIHSPAEPVLQHPRQQSQAPPLHVSLRVDISR